MHCPNLRVFQNHLHQNALVELAADDRRVPADADILGLLFAAASSPFQATWVTNLRFFEPGLPQAYRKAP